MRSESYRPDIDGLRAVAVLSVVLYHYKLACPGGFVGVDIFFVISGFLISTIIYRELDVGTFSLITFWERRIRRIVPALTVVVLATIIAAWFLYLPEDLTMVGKAVFAQAALLSNLFFYRQSLAGGGYFATTAETKTLLHTWSLAVEEQFYLVFPLLLAFLFRFGKPSLSRVLAIIGVMSLLLSVFGIHFFPSATFYLLPTRAWELLLGALLALRKEPFITDKRARESIGWLGVCLIVFAVFSYNSDTPFPGVAAVPPCAGTALVILSSMPTRSVVGRILSLKPVVFIGLISYSFYLWHWPVLVMSKYWAQNWNSAINEQAADFRPAFLLASIMLAILSWRYVETPFRKRRILQNRLQIFTFAGMSTVTLLVLGGSLVLCHGANWRYSGRAASYLESRNRWAFRNDISIGDAAAGRFVKLGSIQPGESIDILVWGDSHGMDICSVIDALCRHYSRSGVQATHGLTPPILEYTNTLPFPGLQEKAIVFNNSIIDFISKRHVKNVILAGRWSGYEPSPLVREKLLMTVQTVIQSGAKCYVLKEIPTQRADVAHLINSAILRGIDLEGLGVTREEYERRNGSLEGTFAEIARMGGTLLDPAGYFLNHKGLYGMTRNDKVLYFDDNHLTIDGAMLLSPLFEPILGGTTTMQSRAENRVEKIARDDTVQSQTGDPHRLTVPPSQSQKEQITFSP